mgnify:CR=1 FL=1
METIEQPRPEGNEERFVKGMANSLILFADTNREVIDKEGMPVAFFSLGTDKGGDDPALIDMEEYGLENEICDKTLHALRMLICARGINKFAYCKMMLNVDPSLPDERLADRITNREAIDAVNTGRKLFNIVVGHLSMRDAEEEVMYTYVQQVAEVKEGNDGILVHHGYGAPDRQIVGTDSETAKNSPLADIFTLPVVVGGEISDEM